MSTKPPTYLPNIALSCALGFENASEQREPILLRVIGEIPPWLSGDLYRTGPGTFRITSPNATNPIDIAHWFDGLGMNHRFHISQDGPSVTYQSRSSTSGLQAAISNAGYISGTTFREQDPCRNIFAKLFTMFKPASPRIGADTLNISVTLTPNIPGLSSSHSSTIVAKTDYNALQVIDASTLEPLRIINYSKLDSRLDGQLAAAHPCQDPSTGEYFNYTLKLGPSPKYTVFKIRPSTIKDDKDKDFDVTVLAEIRDAPPAYLHSFVLTEKYVVLCVWQADYSAGGAAIALNRSILGGMKQWDPSRKALFYVIDRVQGGVIAKYESPPFFVFHCINAYETPTGDIIIDLVAYEDHSILNVLYLENLRALGEANPIRWGRAKRVVLRGILENVDEGLLRQAEFGHSFPQGEESDIELPTIHPALYNQSYRYVYGINRSVGNTNAFSDRIIKVDMSDPDAPPKTWGAPGYTTGEPIFVPDPSSTPPLSSSAGIHATHTRIIRPEDEDNGVLLTAVLDSEAQRSMLVIIDSKTMEEVARAEMDGRHVPFGFHGAFISKM